MADKNEIILYQPDEAIRLEVRLDEETVWLTQAQMAELFETTPQNITIHIRNMYKEGELDIKSTCKDFLQVRTEGKRIVNRIQKIYNLDVIISVGYRVKSLRGIQFRQWENYERKDLPFVKCN
ncbi:MAG: virulence RhuM family protein [Bacteroidales bacterium]|nr:virulence RhuM family protein [Bacteroidales bacterium]